jgi:uncharacterized membrane protein
MALDIQDLVREVLTNALQPSGESSNGTEDSGRPNGGLSGMKGLAAGVGAAALAPAALKGAEKLAKGLGVQGLEDVVKSPGEALGGMASKLGDRATSSVKDKVQDQVDEAGGPGGLVKEAAKGILPFGGGGGDKDGTPGVGKGRRMPVQQSMDIGLPLETVYNQFTQFEEWPKFMHRVTRATQEDDCTVSFEAKIWTRKREFTADIETQRPNERIKWTVSQGLNHTGVVTFHELGPNLTRVLVGFDVKPGGMIEKFARGARHVKRAGRADLHRFKAFIETAGQETGAWRGVIEDGELVEEHDPSYDEQRQYADIEELTEQSGSEEDEDQDDEQKDDEQKDSDRGSAKSRSAEARRSGQGSRQQRREPSQSKGSSSRGRSQSSKSGQTRGRSSGSSRGRSSSSSRSGGSGSSSRSGSSGTSSGRGTSRSSSGRSSGSRGRRQSQSSKR